MKSLVQLLCLLALPLHADLPFAGRIEANDSSHGGSGKLEYLTNGKMMLIRQPGDGFKRASALIDLENDHFTQIQHHNHSYTQIGKLADWPKLMELPDRPSPRSPEPPKVTLLEDKKDILGRATTCILVESMGEKMKILGTAGLPAFYQWFAFCPEPMPSFRLEEQIGTICRQQRKANFPKAKKESYPAGVPKPTHAGVKYGPHARHVFDFWQAKSDQPAPLVLVIHGGGWNSGSKESVNRIANIKALLDAGISVAANNYRYVPQALVEGVTPPVKAPMDDSARALQFLRSKAAAWNIDPVRVAAAGSSAGACTSLWLAYHDDLADPESADPIARQSTRLLCAAVIGAQTSLDPRQAKEWTPNSRYGGHAFGKKSFAEALADRDSILPWIAGNKPNAWRVVRGSPNPASITRSSAASI